MKENIVHGEYINSEMRTAYLVCVIKPRKTSYFPSLCNTGLAKKNEQNHSL